MPRTKEQFQELRKKTRDNILNTALRLFATKGYHGTSINDIAREAGISKGLAYNYFESKEEIMNAIFLQLLELGKEFEKQMDSIDDPYELIKNIITTSFKYYESDEELIRLYILFALQPGILEQAKKISKSFSKRIIMKLEQIFKSLGFKNPKMEVLYLDALIDGVGMNYIAQKKDYPIKQIKEYILKRYSKEGIKKLKNSRY